MASTVIRGAQIKDSTVQRHDLDTSTVGQAVVTKLVQGSGVTLSSTGADSGTGDVTVSTSAIPLASSSTSGLMNQTSGNTTDFIDGTNASQPLQPVIWSVRLRSFNAVGNPTFEIDQINCGQASIAQGIRNIDRWSVAKSGATGNVQVQQMSGPVLVPGTNFAITGKFLRITLTATQASLAAGDRCDLAQIMEGNVLRELISDVTSAQLLVRSSVANLNFGFVLNDAGNAYSLPKLCNIPTANTWTLISLANLPIWTGSGTFPITPGTAGYTIHIGLAHGSTWLPAANNAWVAGNFLGALGQSNFFNSPLNSTFDIAFLQHEPGALCTTPIDCPFRQNYDDSMRYYYKNYAYATKPGTVVSNFAGSAGTGPTAIVNFGNVLGWFPFPKTMAKIPTLTCYSPPTGAANAVRDGANGADRTVTGASSPGETGFTGWAITGQASTTNPWYNFFYTADTGW